LIKLIRFSDYAGMTASVLCMLHCIFMPLLLLVPFVSNLGVGDEFHQVMMLVLCMPITFALVPGFFQHRHWSALFIGMIGLACFIFSAFIIEPYFGQIAEICFASIGSASLFFAHYRNRLLCRACDRICSADQSSGFFLNSKCNTVALEVSNER
jgi:MFS family permease